MNNSKDEAPKWNQYVVNRDAHSIKMFFQVDSSGRYVFINHTNEWDLFTV